MKQSNEKTPFASSFGHFKLVSGCRIYPGNFLCWSCQNFSWSRNIAWISQLSYKANFVVLSLSSKPLDFWSNWVSNKYWLYILGCGLSFWSQFSSKWNCPSPSDNFSNLICLYLFPPFYQSFKT